MKNKNRFLIQATIVFIALLVQAGCAEGPDRAIEYTLFVTPSSLNMIEGDEVQIKASPTTQTFTWESSNTGVATVSSGLVRAIGDGPCLIYVTSSGGLSRTIPVDVVKFLPLTGIYVFNKTNLAPVTTLSLAVGQSIELGVNPEPSNYNERISFNVAWESTHPHIVTVDEHTGAVKAVAAGNAVITVRAVEKLSVIVDIPVSVPQP